MSSFGEDGFGRLYLVDIYSGTIYAMVPEPATWAMLLMAAAADDLACAPPPRRPREGAYSFGALHHFGMTFSTYLRLVE